MPADPDRRADVFQREIVLDTLVRTLVARAGLFDAGDGRQLVREQPAILPDHAVVQRLAGVMQRPPCTSVAPLETASEIWSSTLVRAFSSISERISVPACVPLPTLRPATRAASLAENASPFCPRIRLAQRQVWPALRNLRQDRARDYRIKSGIIEQDERRCCRPVPAALS